GAAVLGVGRLAILGIVGALVLQIGDAVLVVIEIGAAVVVLEAVEVLGLVGALVGGVGAVVAVVVVVGAAVVILEAVLVLGAERALVAPVGDAVAVGVAHVGRVAQRDEQPRLRRADAVDQSRAAADDDRDRAGRVDAQTPLDLERAGVEREARQPGTAVALGDDRHA